MEVQEETTTSQPSTNTSSNNRNDDIKYELFCKWLQQNQQYSSDNLPIELSDSRNSYEYPTNTTTNPILTEDEVSSLTNSDDSAGEVFLDTETDFPSIVLTSDTEHIDLDIFGNDDTTHCTDHLLINYLRADTPSQLSVNDFDCSSSDVTINSQISINSNNSQVAKRKAKHKKGRAPPIPINASDNNNTDLVHDNNENEIPENLHIETDI